MADRIAPLEAWRVEYQQQWQELDKRREQIEAITLGNSHGNAIDYSVSEIDGQSLTLAIADLFEIEKHAMLITNELPNLKTVFIAISYYSFTRDNATFEPFRTRRIKFYSLAPTWSPIAGDIHNFVLGKAEAYTHIMSVARSDNWQGVWKGVTDGSTPLNFLPPDSVVTSSAWGICIHYTADQLEKEAWDIANFNVSSSIEMAARHKGLEQDAFNALARIIDHLQAKGIRVILFTPTYYKKYTEYFMQHGSYIIDNMQNKIKKIQRIYRVEYYNFSNEPEIREQPELFYNSSHLSNCGKRIFSQKLFAALSNQK